jgi:hypothetical protein
MEFSAPPSTPRIEDIEAIARSITEGLDEYVRGLGLVPGATRVVLASDLTSEVNQLSQEIAQAEGSPTLPPFTVERIGGTVLGKTLPHRMDYRDATIVVDAGLIDWSDQVGFAAGIHLLSHELAHVSIGRARWGCGALEGVAFPSHTGTEFARNIARISAEEYRATVLADIVLGTVVTVGLDSGQTEPMTVYHIVGEGYQERLTSVLREVVHPGWPDTVTDYRYGVITLDELGKHLIESTDQVFTLLAHAESSAEAGKKPRPLEVLAHHRGVELYLSPAWNRLIEPARRSPPVPKNLDQVRELEDQIVSEGEAAILAMWSTLGTTVEELENGAWAMWVDDPIR